MNDELFVCPSSTRDAAHLETQMQPALATGHSKNMKSYKWRLLLIYYTSSTCISVIILQVTGKKLIKAIERIRM